MGITNTDVVLSNPAAPDRKATVSCVVDTGALYSLIPKETLASIGLSPRRKQTFTLADGSRVTREVGDAFHRIGDREAAAPVIFGDASDKPLLGVVTLEALGLGVDPAGRNLKPVELLLL